MVKLFGYNLYHEHLLTLLDHHIDFWFLEGGGVEPSEPPSRKHKFLILQEVGLKIMQCL